MDKILEIVAPYQSIPGGIVEAYHALQRSYGYIPEDAIEVAAKTFKISKAEAFGVATFYSYFKIGKRGRNVIRICKSAPCHIAGAAEIVLALEKRLDIKIGESTNDGKFTLEFTECVGRCGETPAITINCKPYGGLTPDMIPSIIDQYQ